MDSTLAIFARALLWASVVFMVNIARTIEAAPPPNDSFANATELILSPAIPDVAVVTNFSGSIAGATTETGESNNEELANYNFRGTIWWRWTCTVESDVEFVTYASVGSLVGAAFTGTSVDNLTTVSAANSDFMFHPDLTFDASVAVFHAIPGTTYWMVVMPLIDVEQPVDFIEGYFLVVPGAAPPPPNPTAPATNDHFANRIVMTGNQWSTNGNIEKATLEAAEKVGVPWDPIQSSVWYSWTASTNGVVYFTGTNFVPNLTFRLSAYRGESLIELVLATPTADGGYLVAPGDTLQVQVGSPYTTGWTHEGGAGAFVLNCHFKARAPASPNDWFTNRLEIITPAYHFEGSIYGATMEPNEPYPFTNHFTSLWWKLLPTEDGVLRVNVSGPYPLSTWVYEGNRLPELTRVANLGENRFQVRGGREYAVQIASGNVASGGIIVDTRFLSTSNDMFAGAIRMEGTNCFAESDFGAATFEAGEPNPGATNTIWFSWASPGTGRVWYSPYHDWWRPAAVYSGYTLETLTPVRYGGGLGNGEASFLAEEGKLYHFQYSGGNSETVKLALRLEPFLAITNDNFADATRLKPGYGFGPISGATREPGEPEHRAGTPYKSIWWKWQAPTHMYAYVSFQGSLTRNLMMSVYTGNSVENLTKVAQGTNDFYLTGDGGVTYYFAASVSEGEVGDVMLSVGGAPREIDKATISIPVPGNLLLEPSWEGTSLQPHHWQKSGDVGGMAKYYGGADGATWPIVPGNGAIAQNIEVTPGHHYQIRYALRASTAPVQVKWNDTVIGVTNVPSDEMGYWHWVTYTTEATTSTALIEFKNLGTRFDRIELDAFSVVDLTAPPSIKKQPWFLECPSQAVRPRSLSESTVHLP
ncbi:MAG: hypothetical protein IPK15_09865 [Verrucomicrobia bacterium]|nr:hypothetical protein [Verrucomicrobiota bacterium]